MDLNVICKMNKLCNYFLTMMVLFLSNGLYSQGFTMQLELMPNEVSLNQFDTMYNHQCKLLINDTSNIDSIHIKIGNTLGGIEVLDASIGFDQNTFLPKDVAYYRKRNTNEIYLDLGNRIKANYYYELSIQDSLGVKSNTVFWNNEIP